MDGQGLKCASALVGGGPHPLSFAWTLSSHLSVVRANGVIICFDITDRRSFERVVSVWHRTMCDLCENASQGWLWEGSRARRDHRVTNYDVSYDSVGVFRWRPLPPPNPCGRTPLIWPTGRGVFHSPAAMRKLYGFASANHPCGHSLPAGWHRPALGGLQRWVEGGGGMVSAEVCHHPEY